MLLERFSYAEQVHTQPEYNAKSVLHIHFQRLLDLSQKYHAWNVEVKHIQPLVHLSAQLVKEAHIGIRQYVDVNFAKLVGLQTLTVQICAINAHQHTCPLQTEPYAFKLANQDLLQMRKRLVARFVMMELLQTQPPMCANGAKQEHIQLLKRLIVNHVQMEQ